MILSSRLFSLGLVLVLMLVLALQLPISVQATSQPTYFEASAQANIQGAQTASHFTSNVNPGRYVENPDTGKCTFVIGSISATHQTATDDESPRDDESPGDGSDESTSPGDGSDESPLDEFTIG